MNPKHNLTTNDGAAPRSIPNAETLQTDALRKECEELMKESLAGALTDEDSKRFSELLLLFPEARRELEMLQVTAQQCREYTVPERNKEAQAQLEERIITRLEEISTHTAKRARRSPLTLITRLPSRKFIWQVGGMAAVFVCGIALGRWTNAGQQHTAYSSNPDIMRLASTNATQSEKEELQNFLHDAHLLMLGVMSMNAECGVPHPQTLIAQRERCVELLARAQALRHNLRPHDERHFAQVIMQVESALAELAATQPAAVNAVTIRSIQNRTDDALCEVTTALAAAKQ